MKKLVLISFLGLFSFNVFSYSDLHYETEGVEEDYQFAKVRVMINPDCDENLDPCYKEELEVLEELDESEAESLEEDHQFARVQVM